MKLFQLLLCFFFLTVALSFGNNGFAMASESSTDDSEGKPDDELSTQSGENYDEQNAFIESNAETANSADESLTEGSLDEFSESSGDEPLN